MAGKATWPQQARTLIGSAAALAAGAALLSSAWAQDSQSAVGFFVSEAARSAQPVARPDPVQPIASPSSPEQGRAVRTIQTVPASKARYASLPKPGKAAARADARGSGRPAEPDARKPELLTRLDPSDPIGAVLKDPTLKAGDIVVFPDGPKVFKGESKGPHRLSGFEDAGSSRLVPKSTRVALAELSAAKPRGATKALPLRGPSLAASSSGEPTARGSSPRVVYQDGRVAQRP